jgi:hypothetical protein
VVTSTEKQERNSPLGEKGAGTAEESGENASMQAGTNTLRPLPDMGSPCLGFHRTLSPCSGGGNLSRHEFNET